MNAAVLPAAAALNQRFLLDYPHEAARLLEAMAPEEAAAVLSQQPAHAVVRAWQALGPDVARAILEQLPDAMAGQLLAEAEPVVAAAVVAQWEPDERERRLASLDPQVARELRDLLSYPERSAGRLMDADATPLHESLSVGQALARLKAMRRHGMRELFVVDDEGRLTGRVEIQDLATTDDARPLRDVTRPLLAAVQAFDPEEDVVALLQHKPITEVPVVNVAGRFVGVIRHAALLSALEQASSVDIQTMVGASADERALSGPLFAVRKRLPWLQVNLVSAFLAASVVGFFEGTIAQFTALAVLMPVVAGQSGNTGQQALAVTMRGLILREIGLRHWPRVLAKEAGAGLVNGLAVAATTGLAVYLWSGSPVLVAIIASAMVIAMTIAGVSGALVPIMLRRFGLDPAQSSSIVLTSITDITGFMAFLGIATLLASRLA